MSQLSNLKDSSAFSFLYFLSVSWIKLQQIIKIVGHTLMEQQNYRFPKTFTQCCRLKYVPETSDLALSPFFSCVTSITSFRFITTYSLASSVFLSIVDVILQKWWPGWGGGGGGRSTCEAVCRQARCTCLSLVERLLRCAFILTVKSNGATASSLCAQQNNKWSL